AALPSSSPGDRMGTLNGGTDVAPDGRFRISGLRPGDWTVHVSAPGYGPTISLPVRLGLDGDGSVGTIPLPPPARLVLALTSAGNPVPGAEVGLSTPPLAPAQLYALAGASEPGPGPRVTSDGAGRATLGELAPGQVWVAIFADGYPPTSSGPHQVSSDPEP